MTNQASPTPTPITIDKSGMPAKEVMTRISACLMACTDQTTEFLLDVVNSGKTIRQAVEADKAKFEERYLELLKERDTLQEKVDTFQRTKENTARRQTSILVDVVEQLKELLKTDFDVNTSYIPGTSCEEALADVGRKLSEFQLLTGCNTPHEFSTRNLTPISERRVHDVFRQWCVHFNGNYEVTPGQALEIAKRLQFPWTPRTREGMEHSK